MLSARGRVKGGGVGVLAKLLLLSRCSADMLVAMSNAGGSGDDGEGSAFSRISC